MSDARPPSVHRRIITAACVAGLTLVCVLGAWLGYQWYQSQVRPVAVGELVMTTGEFRSPDGTTVLSLKLSDDRRSINAWMTRQVGSDKTAQVGWTIDAAQPWIFTFDRAGKVWGYWPPDGTHTWQATLVADTTTRVGEGGGWDDVPESFLLSLPEEERDSYLIWREQQAAILGHEPDSPI